MINPMLTGVSSAAQALAALIAGGQSNPASSSAGAFSTGQGLPAGGASPQPSNASNKFAPAMLGVLTALQDPSSAAAGFASGAQTAVGQDVQSVGDMLDTMKAAATGGATPSNIAASAQATGSAAAGSLSIAANSTLSGLMGGHHHLHHHHGGAAPGSVDGSASAAANPLSLNGGVLAV